MGSINKETDDYVLGRGIRESIRLDAQHLLWKLHLGYALHPSIKRSEPLRIAEVGTGTAIWLLDLAQDLPLDTQFHGYDISANQFPPQALWPENLDLGILNALEDPPSRLLGYYDVVHVRMWASNLRSREASILIRNLKAMLKPGGFIQWEDADLVDQHLQSQPAQELEVVAKDLFKKAGIDYSWVRKIPRSLEQEAFLLQDEKTNVFSPSMTQLCTNTYLMALTEIFEGIKRSDDGSLVTLISSCETALGRLIHEYNRGLVYNWRPVSVLAQKPL